MTSSYIVLITAGERNGVTREHVRRLFDGLLVGRIVVADLVGSSAFAFFAERGARDSALRRSDGGLVVSPCTTAAAQAVVATVWDYADCPEREWTLDDAPGGALHVRANAAARRVQSWMGGETVRSGQSDITSVPFALFTAVPSFRVHLPQRVAAGVCAHLEAHRRPSASVAAAPPTPPTATYQKLRAQLAQAAERADAASRRAEERGAAVAEITAQRDRLLALSKQHLQLQAQQQAQLPAAEAQQRAIAELTAELAELTRANVALRAEREASEQRASASEAARRTLVAADAEQAAQLARALEQNDAGVSRHESTKEAMLSLLEQKALALQTMEQRHNAVLVQRAAEVSEARAQARAAAASDYREEAEAARGKARRAMDREVAAAHAELEARSSEASDLATTNEGMLSLLEDKTIALRHLKAEHERLLTAHAEQLAAMRDDMDGASRASTRAALEKQKAQAMREMHRLRNAAKGEMDRVVKAEREVQAQLKEKLARGHAEALAEGAVEQRSRAKQRVASLKRAHAAATKQSAIAHSDEMERRMVQVQAEQRKRLQTLGAEHEAVLKECEATYSMLDDLRQEHRRQLQAVQSRMAEDHAAAMLRQRHSAQQALRDAVGREQQEKRTALMRSQSKLTELATKLQQLERRAGQGGTPPPQRTNV